MKLVEYVFVLFFLRVRRRLIELLADQVSGCLGCHVGQLRVGLAEYVLVVVPFG